MSILMAGAMAGVAVLRRHPLHLIWRTRWLLLVLVLGYGFSLPGEALMPFLGEWTPTRPGLLMGVERAMHLMALLLWLDVLVLSLSGEQMLAGLYALMTPLARMGVDTGRVAMRLALTLKAIERLEQGDGVPSGAKRRGMGRGNLRHLFDPVPGDWLAEQVVLARYPVGGRDVIIPVLIMVVFGVLVWTGGWQ
jgi:hypothetical protein